METACEECDCIIETLALSDGEKLSCPQCGNMIRSKQKNAFDKVLAGALAGVLFFIPTNIMPLMQFDIAGQQTTSTILGGIVHLANQGYWWVAFLVFVVSMLAPALLFVVCGSVAFCYKTNRFSAFVPIALKLEHKLREWGMLEVYLLGILVSFIKLIDMGHIEFDLGFVCYVGLVVCTLVMTRNFDHWQVWRWWEKKPHE